MEWLSIVPVILAAAGLLFLPGFVLGAVLGLRGLWLYSLAPVLSASLYAIASIALPYLGLHWNPINAFSFAGIFGAFVYLLFRFLLRARFIGSPDRSPGSKWGTAAGWIVAATVLGIWLLSGIGSPTGISQTFDNIFHLNAVSFIAANGNASPLAIGELTSPGSDGGVYPLGWHALVALLESSLGISTAVAVNGFNLVVATTIWPLGVLLLTRQLVGRSWSAMLCTGILAAAFPAFPLNMLHFGVLYPYFLGLSMVPAVIAVLLQLLNMTREPVIGGRLGLAVLLAGMIPGVTIAHPGAMMVALAFSVPIVFVGVLTGWRDCSRRSQVLRLVWLLLYCAVGYVLLDNLRPGVMWSARTTAVEAFWRTLSLQLGGLGLPLVLAALVIFGVIIALRSRTAAELAAVGIWVVAAALHFVAVGVDTAWVRAVTGVWYGDPPRLEAIVPMAAIPLAVLGMERLLRLSAKLKRPGKIFYQAASVILLLALSQIGSGYLSITEQMKSGYEIRNDSPLLSSDELVLLKRLADEVNSDEMITGSPWTGTSLALAFSDRDVVMPHILMDLEGDRATIMNRLRYAETDPAVCSAVNNLNVRWLLDFGSREVHGARHTYPGLSGIADTDIVQLVDREGEARLYRIVACDD